VDQLTEEQKQLVKQGLPVPVREPKREELLSEDSN
jgi:hypothetical protein